MSVGHSVLVVPVPELEHAVRAHWERHEPTWVSSDPEFTHAHITVLAPWLAAPTPAELDAVAAIAGAVPPFGYDLADVAEFPDGTLHTPPVPGAPFLALTRAAFTAFPDCAPYDGQFGTVDDLVPHLTLDHRLTGATLASTSTALDAVLPRRCRAERLEWHWYDEGGCALRARWPLGPGP
ncbi:2'-5' RNA ligase family protein [Nocardioides sp. BGMRC 2183]|nr:2'-5' RNA ligase family protein [Nocardioides sp. BGMRC 2183]